MRASKAPNGLFRSQVNQLVRIETGTVFDVADGEFRSASVLIEGNPNKVSAKTLIAASGGFESNLEWLKEGWGPMADNSLIRGTPYNKGTVLKRLLALGVESSAIHRKATWSRSMAVPRSSTAES